MSIVRAVYVSTMRLLQLIIAFIRNLCNGNRNKKRMDVDDLPFEVVVDNGRTERKGEERASLLQNEVTDSWGDDDWDKKEEVNDKIEQWRNSNAQKPDTHTKPDDDLFSTLEPTITSARKVVLAPRGGFRDTAPKKSRFDFNEANVGATPTLGDIDDDLLGWGDDDLDSTLKEHREEHHKQLQQEHERRLQQKKLQNAGTHHML
ncbi:uncharacterized protein CELE_ZK154.4 [Caenorhabditis elegans]|uniref:Uncharacterized protein n=1 Tax=Caenorhabditis elegans TaxID=6239 RepID=Q94313_CAEEL|nr:Uncharacterized protein CELE_ZK154.4 [Caenorhabditis elegans]CCD67559.1 Uncharacterized protein CELE_ZK154.4 [Caenorhabditis elegans]|eukprot:NP_509315.1 Uncharacterized protein CELE_ZK154.4 [Caenorhabditis elegans]